MLIDVVQEDVERLFIASLKESTVKPTSRGVLRCAFSTIQLHTDPDSMLGLVKDVLRHNEARLYFCHDGDLVIMWKGNLKDIRDTLVYTLKQYYKDKLDGVPDDEVFRFYDTMVQAEELQILMRDKIDRLPEAPVVEPNAATAHPKPDLEVAVARPKPSYTLDQLQILSKALRARKRRRNIEILVVEDQDFSRKMLTGLLEKNWTCHAAKNGAEALQLYATHAPNICFLDVELPDANGHELAELFTANDPEKFIVMVTANHYVHDVVTAKQNRVDGFIVKPYNKQKIFHAVESHMIKNAM